MIGMDAFVRHHISASHCIYSGRGTAGRNELRGSRGDDSSTWTGASGSGMASGGLEYSILAIVGIEATPREEGCFASKY